MKLKKSIQRHHKLQKTHKLFYGKYPYCVELIYIDGSDMVFRRARYSKEDYKRAEDWCLDKNKEFNYVLAPRAVRDKALLKKFMLGILPFIHSKSQHIGINSNFRIYSCNKKDHDHVIQQLNQFVYKVIEPANDEELNIVSKDRQIVLCDKYPHKLFKFKAIFKSNIPVSIKEQIRTSLYHYPNDSIRIPGSTRKFLEGERTWTNHYIYVKDEKLLTLLMLISGSYLSSTYEFKTRDSINT